MTGNELNYAFQQTVNSNYNFGSGDKLIDSFPTWPSMKTKNWFNPYDQFNFFCLKNGDTPLTYSGDYEKVDTTLVYPQFNINPNNGESGKDLYVGFFLSPDSYFAKNVKFYHKDKDYEGVAFTKDDVSIRFQIIASDGTNAYNKGVIIKLANNLSNFFGNTPYPAVTGYYDTFNKTVDYISYYNFKIDLLYLYRNGIHIDLSNNSSELYVLN